MRSVLIGAGIPETEIVEYQAGKHVFVLMYVRHKREARTLQFRLSQAGLSGLEMQVSVLRPKDWQEAWKDEIRPFQLTPKFDVVPLWREREYKPSPRIPLVIDTTLSFGTGLHETTRFVALLIEKCEGKFSRFLDVGTGTGILSLVAYHCGASLIDMVDINADCLMTAKKNMKHNQAAYHKVFCSDVASLKAGPYDMVAANLTSRDLKTLAAVLVSLTGPGGYLALSGVAVEHLPDVRRHFKGAPLRCLKVMKGRSWGALLYKKIR